MVAPSVVIVSTSASDLNGHTTGLWIEELAAPYYIFTNAGYTVTIASPKGGAIPIDVGSMQPGFFTDEAKKFMHDPEAYGKLSHSATIGTIDWSSVDAVYVAGGHGACADLTHDADLKTAIESVYAANKIVASVCHGVIALTDCQGPNGNALVSDKVVTGFANSEEEVVQLTKLVPFLLETKLKELGGKYEKADDWHPKVCADGNLVTGQNPQSSADVAKKVVEMLTAVAGN
jgi:putative intracellular protease/amidase